MKRPHTSEQRRQRAGRWFARALFVFGGAVAGTAAAWAITSATASADSALPQDPARAADRQPTDLRQPDGSIMSGTDAVLDATGDVAGTTAEFAGRAAGAAAQHGTSGAARSPEATNRGRQAGEVREAVHQFARDAVIHPAHRIVGAAEHVAREPQDASRVVQQVIAPSSGFLDLLGPSVGEVIKLPDLRGRGDQHQAKPVTTPPASAPAVAAVAPAGPISPVLDEVVAQHHLRKLGLDASAEGRSHGLKTVKAPHDPTRRPMAPSGIPPVPGGSTTGGHVDGPLLGVAAGALTAVDADGSRAMRRGIRRTPAEPGEQPGVTPD